MQRNTLMFTSATMRRTIEAIIDSKKVSERDVKNTFIKWHNEIKEYSLNNGLIKEEYFRNAAIVDIMRNTIGFFGRMFK